MYRKVDLKRILLYEKRNHYLFSINRISRLERNQFYFLPICMGGAQIYKLLEVEIFVEKYLTIVI